MSSNRMTSISSVSISSSPHECLGVESDASLSQLHGAFVRSACFRCSKHSFATLVSSFEMLVNIKAESATPTRSSPPRARYLHFTMPQNQCRGDMQGAARLQRICALLGKLPRDVRQQMIATQMSEAQRRSLEEWMLTEHAPAAKRYRQKLQAGCKRPLSERSLCRWLSRGGRVGYRPIIHLAGGLYAQAEFSFDFRKSVSALGVLIAMRSFCQAAWEKTAAFLSGQQQEEVLGSQVEALRCAISLVLSRCASASSYQHRISFKTRLRLGQGSLDIGGQLVNGYREMASHASTDLGVALSAWHRLLVRRPLQHFAGASKRVCKNALCTKTRGSLRPSQGDDLREKAVQHELGCLLKRLEGAAKPKSAAKRQMITDVKRKRIAKYLSSESAAT